MATIQEINMICMPHMSILRYMSQEIILRNQAVLKFIRFSTKKRTNNLSSCLKTCLKKIFSQDMRNVKLTAQIYNFFYRLLSGIGISGLVWGPFGGLFLGALLLLVDDEVPLGMALGGFGTGLELLILLFLESLQPVHLLFTC